MRPINFRQRCSAMLTTFGMMTLLSLAALVFVDRSTLSMRQTRRQSYEIRTTSLCEAGVQVVLQNLWQTFKTSQKFTNLDTTCANASNSAPKATATGSISGVGNYSAGVTLIATPSGDSYSRTVRVRCVGWIDINGSGVLDTPDPQKTVDVTVTFQLQRSQVFDYGYFVNNYGWMSGFSETSLIINGDMRANGNFDFTNGSPTVNGSVYASVNEKLATPVAGLVNTPPVKWSTSNYRTMQTNSDSSGDDEARWRQGYDSTTFGTKGTATYENWRDTIFDADASIINNRIAGTVIADSTGYDAWSRTSGGSSATSTLLDTTQTKELTMPDLSDITTYQATSQSYTDPKTTFADGTANPNAGQGAWVKVYNSTTHAYQTVTTNGVVTGSVVLVGTSNNPILIHGPVTVTQDVLIKGTVSGQGTIYAGRNAHIVGSIIYKNKPDFRGSNATSIDNANEKKDVLALCARGSVIMGDTTNFTNTNFQYMTPPFTKGRYDDSGNWIPAFNAYDTDSTGYCKYQTCLGDSTMRSVAEGVNQIDAVVYTNFLGGGSLGTGGQVTFNGSIISKDEAMVVYSTPMHMNYDGRIRERKITSTPLIDIALPRSPIMLKVSWKDRGFIYASNRQD